MKNFLIVICACFIALIPANTGAQTIVGDIPQNLPENIRQWFE